MAELIEQQESPVGERKQPPRSRGGFWVGVILLLVIGLAAAGFYLFTQLRAKQDDLGGEVKNEMSKQMAAYQTQLSSLSSQVTALQTDIASKDARINKTIADFSQAHNEKLGTTRKELNESILKLQRQLGKTRGDWLIADAEYLLSVANDRLYLIGDVNTTRQALEAADQRLRESGDAAAYKVRDQVIKDIAALSTVKAADVVGIYSSIQALEARIDNLILLLPHAGKTPDISVKTDAPVDEQAQESESLLDSAKHKLNEIVTIKHTDHPIAEILTPEQAQFIHEQLRTKLEIVKIALVQQNEALYQASLADAKAWLEQQFTQNNDTKSFVAELNRFAAIKIRSQFPDISLSLKMLRDITKLHLETDKAINPDESINSNPTSETNNADLENTTKPPESIEQPTTAVQPVETQSNSANSPIPSTEPAQPPLIPAPDAESSTQPASMPDEKPQVVPSIQQAPIETPKAVMEASPSQSEPTNVDTDSGEPQAMDTHEPPKEEPPLVDKILDQIKQYLPGKH